jgi:drug/metabolite transporter (DMT)-like permease
VPADPQHFTPPAPRGALTGIAFKVASVIIFLGMSSLLKAAPHIPAGELVFFRSFFALIPVLGYLAWRRELSTGLQTAHFASHMGRGLIGTTSMMLGFYALTQLPLPEAVAINYATPLVIVVLSALFFHEKIRVYRWGAVLVGFVGVLIIMSPRLTIFSGGVADTPGTTLGALAALLSCFFAAVAMLLVRKLVATERSATVVLYFSLNSSLIGLLTLPFGWVMPTPVEFAFLVGAGLCGGVAQILLTESYRHAEMSVVAPFEYASLIFSVAIGYFIFADPPTLTMLVGGVIVVGSGLFIIWREHRLGLDSRRGERTTPSS